MAISSIDDYQFNRWLSAAILGMSWTKHEKWLHLCLWTWPQSVLVNLTSKVNKATNLRALFSIFHRKKGCSGGIRTHNLLLSRLLLYQMSMHTQLNFSTLINIINYCHVVNPVQRARRKNGSLCLQLCSISQRYDRYLSWSILYKIILADYLQS